MLVRANVTSKNLISPYEKLEAILGLLLLFSEGVTKSGVVGANSSAGANADEALGVRSADSLVPIFPPGLGPTLLSDTALKTKRTKSLL